MNKLTKFKFTIDLIIFALLLGLIAYHLATGNNLLNDYLGSLSGHSNEILYVSALIQFLVLVIQPDKKINNFINSRMKRR